MTEIKICGLMRPEDAECINSLRISYAGLMCYQKSKRYVMPERALEIRNRFSRSVRAVGVFVDEDPLRIAEIARYLSLDMIQLHGAETEDEVQTIREKTGLPVIKAFRVETPEDVKRAAGSHADEILLDHGAGGTGETFDWSLLDGIKRNFFLAGGLSPENVTDAINRVHPFGVDVSSGVETDGKKDVTKMKQFVEAVRRSDHV